MGKDEKAIAPAGQADWYADVPRSIRLHVIVGMTALGVTFCGFGVWAATAPLASAIIAQGSFVATGNNKIVQHLEGGIIKELHVGEGSKVREGDVLVTLDDTAALANERALKLRWLRLEAVVARLRAEALGARVFALPPMLVKEASDPDVVAIAESQHVIFNSRKVKLEEQLNLVDKNIRSLEFRSKGYRGQKEALERQVVLLEEERDSKAKLSKAGYMKRTDYLAVERAIAGGKAAIGHDREQRHRPKGCNEAQGFARREGADRLHDRLERLLAGTQRRPDVKLADLQRFGRRHEVVSFPRRVPAAAAGIHGRAAVARP